MSAVLVLGLNSLANHNIIPHDGKNLSVPLLVKALGEAYNTSPELSTIVSLGGVSTSPNPSGGTFDLDDLNKHNIIEHDGSLSRADFNLGGDDHTFRPDIFGTVLKFFDGMANVTIPAAAAARYQRIQRERYRDSHFMYGPSQMFSSYAETALYFLSMVDPSTGATPVDFVRILFEEERLPYKEGWRPPTQQINALTLASTVLQLALATPEKTFPYSVPGFNTTDTVDNESHGFQNEASKWQILFHNPI
jgi:hypothetical protein